MKKNYKKLSGSSLVIFILGLMTMFAFAGLVVDLGMVMATQQELQKAAETAVLSAAANMEPQKSDTGVISIDTSTVASTVADTFNKMKSSSFLINSASITSTTVKELSKAVGVEVRATANLYFMSAIGLTGVQVIAQATAISDPVYPSPYFPRYPAVGSVIGTSGTNQAGIYGYADNQSLDLGSCGYTLLRMPAFVVDGTGADLYIKEKDFLDGYFVYIGVPYSYGSTSTSSIRWVNVSCTGIPASGAATTSQVGSYLSDVVYASGTWQITQAKFYGSGYFDIGKKCYDSSNNLIYDGSIIKTAIYIAIIDDCVNDGFSTTDFTNPVVSTTQAQIDTVGVLHHSRLIKYAYINLDTDGDGVIDFLEDAIGLNKNSTDTDGDGIPDGSEYVGWFGAYIPITSSGIAQAYFTNPKISDHP